MRREKVSYYEYPEQNCQLKRKMRGSQKIVRREAEIFSYLANILCQECIFLTAKRSLKVKKFLKIGSREVGI